MIQTSAQLSVSSLRLLFRTKPEVKSTQVRSVKELDITDLLQVYDGDKVAQLVGCRTSNQRGRWFDSRHTPGTLVVLGQNSLFHIASVYPAAKWVP